MLQLIPLAYYAQEKGGVFAIDEQLKVNSDFDLKLLKLEKAQDGKLVIKKDSSLDKEEYKLEVTPDLISIKASSETGAYYALQTLRQIGRFELGSKEIPCCIINDKPRFSWRGVQLDESRHFFGKEYVKKLLDMMFMLKLNVFHWHLTDDQGWRIEIKKYPLLTEIGSKRAYTQIHGWGSTDIINEEYSGFYTQDDIKEIVDYAAKRGIMVVPEIDFPAHCAAAIAAYPWLACREINRDVPGYFGGAIPQRKLRQFDWNRPICPGKDKTVDFVKNVMMRFAHFSLHLIFISAVTKHRSRSGKNALAVKRELRITTLRTRKICRAGLIMKFLRLSSQRARGLSVGTRF